MDNSILTCTFLNQPNSMETRSCRIDYQLCSLESEEFSTFEVNTTSNVAAINLKMLQGSSGTYCYNVIASNGTFTIKVNGQLGKPTTP